MNINRKVGKRFGWAMLFAFFLMNIIAAFHAYKFTHFATAQLAKTKSPKDLGILGKVQALLFGINNPRPTNNIAPNMPFETVYLESSEKIECWHVKIPNSKGTVAIFHGFSGNKGSMLDKSDAFNALGYSTFLVDFIGTGGSEGSQTTIGFKEGQDVKVVIDYLRQQQKEQNVIVFGTSMGAAAILKAAQTFDIQPNAAILECPFGTMYKTVCARFDHMNVPPFPMAGLLVFWGGIENGFWAFSHNPQDYAKAVHFPMLLLYGEKDIEVSREETDALFQNLGGVKVLKTYPEAGHENYLTHYSKEWTSDVSNFLAAQVPPQ